MLRDWYVESFQLALFVGPNWARRPLFADLVGIEPDDVSESSQFQLRQEAGPLSTAYLRVSQQPGRVDIFLTDIPNRNTSNPSAPDYQKFFWIGKLDLALPLFDKLIKNMAPFSSPLQRIAYLMTMILPAADARASALALRENLPLVTFDPDHDTDISWQINRSRTIPEIGVINRLSKWNAIQSAVITVPLGFLAAPPILPLPPQPTDFAARAELDINTSPSNHEISVDAAPSVIRQLRSLALEFTERGDTP